MNDLPTILGICGRRRHGKDTVASVFVKEHGFRLLRFADPIKAMLRAYLEMMCPDCDSVIERMIEGDLKEQPSPLLADRSPRYFMQHLGTEFGREMMGRNFWVNALIFRAEQHHRRVVVPDVRFENEAAAIRAAGGGILRVVAVNEDGLRVQPPAGEHSSEEEGDAILADWVIENDRRTLDHIRGTAAAIAAGFLAPKSDGRISSALRRELITDASRRRALGSPSPRGP